MRVLVTGGTGFIGSHTCIELERRGYMPVVLDRMRLRDPAVGVRYEEHFGDVCDRTGIEKIIGACEGVIHLAGMLGTQETVRHPHAAAETNVMGTLNVLHACETYKLPLVYISVGNWWMNNPYSISKNCAERFALMYRKELGTKVSVVRALNAYGPGQKAKPVRKIIPTFINACLEGRPIQIYGDGTQIMDMVYVSDVAHVLVRALEELPESVVEAGTGRSTTVNEIAAAVIDAVGQGWFEHIPMRPGEEPHSTVLADTKSLEPLGIDPKSFTTLEDGLCKTVESYTSSGPLVASLGP